VSDLAAARVLLIGTGRHRSGSGMPDVPAVATTLRDLRKSLIERCGVGRDSISIILDLVNPMALGEAIASAAEQATDILIVYYVGHGLVSSDSALYLATRSTDYRPSRIEHTALPYRALRTYVRDCPALSKIVILDCCWAGLAFEALGDSTHLADLSRIEGTFVLTSAARMRRRSPGPTDGTPSSVAHS
jgi:uncharacterized caspase-like protein